VANYDDKPARRGLTVEVRNGDFNYALRKFKKKVQEDGILQTLREKEFFEKPSIKRAKAKKAGRARWLKKQAKMDGDTTTTSGSKRKR
jgi:small subunit ribosomal protein S21